MLLALVLLSTTGTITAVIVEAFAAMVIVGVVTIVEDVIVALVLVTWGLAAMVTVGIVTIVEDVIVALVLVTSSVVVMVI